MKTSGNNLSTVQIDDVSIKTAIPDAVQEYKLFLPATVTSAVNFSHDEPAIDKVGMTDTGVTETYTGFDTALSEGGRKYVKVKLSRSAAEAAGLSQLKTVVTATWAETDPTAGDVAKQAQAEILLTARVL